MIYRKRGSVARWENGTLVRVTERGMAIEKEKRFECHPETGDDVPHVDESRVLAAAQAIQAGVGGVTIERLIVIEGIAQHELIDDDQEPLIRLRHLLPSGGEKATQLQDASDSVAFSPLRGEKVPKADEGSVIRTWTEHTRRMHLSLVHARTRAILDFGFFETKDVIRVAGILARTDGIEREAPPRLRLAPHVTAALIPSLVGMTPPNVRLVQTAGGVDGYGEPIVEATDAWPNAYRPSYRVRPVRMPLQLRLECDVTAIDRSRPVAAALLAPVAIEDGALVLRVLVDDGERAFPSIVRVARIDAVADERIWYPYGGGSFGAEMML